MLTVHVPVPLIVRHLLAVELHLSWTSDSNTVPLSCVPEVPPSYIAPEIIQSPVSIFENEITWPFSSPFGKVNVTSPALSASHVLPSSVSMFIVCDVVVSIVGGWGISNLLEVSEATERLPSLSHSYWVSVPILTVVGVGVPGSGLPVLTILI